VFVARTLPDFSAAVQEMSTLRVGRQRAPPEAGGACPPSPVNPITFRAGVAAIADASTVSASSPN
jgi:hypothetical protein